MPSATAIQKAIRIRRARSVMGEAEQGYLAVRAAAAEADELGFLEKSFNRMLEEIGTTISSVQREADEVAVLQRERKRRVEAADAYREAGRDDLVASEEREAELIDAYLPAQLSDEELGAIVGDAVAESGASSPKEMGRVMSMVMPRVQGRADGKRVSALVKEKLTA